MDGWVDGRIDGGGDRLSISQVATPRSRALSMACFVIKAKVTRGQHLISLGYRACKRASERVCCVCESMCACVCVCARMCVCAVRRVVDGFPLLPQFWCVRDGGRFKIYRPSRRGGRTTTRNPTQTNCACLSAGETNLGLRTRYSYGSWDWDLVVSSPWPGLPWNR